jgi:tight adherence protein B
MADTFILCFLAAFSVGLGSWALVNIALQFANGDRRRLKKRLLGTRGNSEAEVSESQRSIRTDVPKEGFEGKLLKHKLFRTIDALVQLSFPELGLSKFLSIMSGITVTVFLLVLALSMNPIVSLVAATLGGITPLLYLTKRKIKRQKLLDDQLPDAMDFLGRALKAGHSLSSGLQMMGAELPQPIAGEFQNAYDQHSLGIAMEVALKGMTRRIDSTDFAFFVTAVLIQRQTGGDLSEVLKNISGMMRQRVRLAQQVKAKTAEGRFTGYLLTAFPAVIFVILYFINRAYASRLTDTSQGLKLLCLAFIMQVLGLVLIRRLTQVKI